MKSIKYYICILLFNVILFSCASNKTTSYAVDYEKEHSPKQEFGFQNKEASDLCYEGWFLINELNDTFFMKNQTRNLSNDEINNLYDEKIQAALNDFEQSNSLEKNTWNYKGIAEVYKIKKTRVGYNEISYYSNLEIQNLVESYKFKQDTDIYLKIQELIFELSFDDRLSIYNELISLSHDQSQLADFHYNKGMIYISKCDYSNSYNEIKTALELSDNFVNSDKYFSQLITIADLDESINIQAILNDSIKKEKDKNKLAFLQYEQGKVYQYSNDDNINAYNQYVTATKNASDENLIQSIEYHLSRIKDNYKTSCDDKYRKLIVAKKAGFSSYDEYQAFLNRSDFETFYRALNLGKETNYMPGDIIIAPSQRLSITDVEQSQAGYIYLVTGYGQNQLSKCCMVISDYQIQNIVYFGEGLITQKLVLSYQGKSTYRRGYTIVDCDVFKEITPFSPVLAELSERINEAVEYEKRDFDYSLEKLSGEEYKLLIENNYSVALYPNGYQKLSNACTEEIIAKTNKKETINYNNWKTVFNAILSSSFEISQNDYESLCEIFNISDEFNSYFEKYIDKTNYNPKWFHDSYYTNPKNLNTYMTHVKDVSNDTEIFFHYITWYGIKDEKIIKTLIKKGLNVKIINSSNCDMIFEYFGNLPPNILQIFIDNGFDINQKVPLYENRTLLSAFKYVYHEEEEIGCEHTLRKDVIDCLIKNGAKE